MNGIFGLIRSVVVWLIGSCLEPPWLIGSYALYGITLPFCNATVPLIEPYSALRAKVLLAISSSTKLTRPGLPATLQSLLYNVLVPPLTPLAGYSFTSPEGFMGAASVVEPVQS